MFTKEQTSERLNFITFGKFYILIKLIQGFKFTSFDLVKNTDHQFRNCLLRVATIGYHYDYNKIIIHSFLISSLFFEFNQFEKINILYIS